MHQYTNTYMVEYIHICSVIHSHINAVLVDIIYASLLLCIIPMNGVCVCVCVCMCVIVVVYGAEEDAKNRSLRCPLSSLYTSH